MHGAAAHEEVLLRVIQRFLFAQHHRDVEVGEVRMVFEAGAQDRLHAEGGGGPETGPCAGSGGRGEEAGAVEGKVHALVDEVAGEGVGRRGRGGRGVGGGDGGQGSEHAERGEAHAAMGGRRAGRPCREKLDTLPGEVAQVGVGAGDLGEAADATAVGRGGEKPGDAQVEPGLAWWQGERVPFGRAGALVVGAKRAGGGEGEREAEEREAAGEPERGAAWSEARGEVGGPREDEAADGDGGPDGGGQRDEAAMGEEGAEAPGQHQPEKRGAVGEAAWCHALAAKGPRRGRRARALGKTRWGRRAGERRAGDLAWFLAIFSGWKWTWRNGEAKS